MKANLSNLSTPGCSSPCQTAVGFSGLSPLHLLRCCETSPIMHIGQKCLRNLTSVFNGMIRGIFPSTAAPYFFRCQTFWNPQEGKRAVIILTKQLMKKMLSLCWKKRNWMKLECHLMPQLTSHFLKKFLVFTPNLWRMSICLLVTIALQSQNCFVDEYTIHGMLLP